MADINQRRAFQFQDGEQMVAFTYASEEYDRPAQRIRGALTVRRVPTLSYTQYLVNGVPVDPETITRG